MKNDTKPQNVVEDTPKTINNNYDKTCLREFGDFYTEIEESAVRKAKEYAEYVMEKQPKIYREGEKTDTFSSKPVFILFLCLIIPFFSMYSNMKKYNEDDYQSKNTSYENDIEQLTNEKEDEEDSKLTEAEYKKLCERKEYKELLHKSEDLAGKKVKVDVKVRVADQDRIEYKTMHDTLLCDPVKDSDSPMFGSVMLEFDSETSELKQEIIDNKCSTVYGKVEKDGLSLISVTIKVKYAKKIKSK
jgi:hypothetical protein